MQARFDINVAAVGKTVLIAVVADGLPVTCLPASGDI